MRPSCIVKAEPLSKLRARLTFEDGVVKTVDLSKNFRHPIFEPVKKREMFKRMRVGESGELKWPNGADICPDVLYYDGAPPWAIKSKKHGS